jgi:mannose-1-phosphate guanylyltransferase
MGETNNIRPIILAGGAGTRLWPLSTAGRPKHLLNLVGDQTLFEATVERLRSFQPPMIVASAAQKQLLLPYLPRGAELILEPFKRDSGGAIALAVAASGPDDMLLICPSDHHIAYEEAFLAAVERAVPAALGGRLVTFGIEPDHPATGYGYIAAAAGEGVRPVERFVEKPERGAAEAMLASGGHYWNAGIFLGLAATWSAELERHAPELLDAARGGFLRGATDRGAMHIDEASFAAAPSISIDYAVMEKSDRVSVVPVSMGWSDIGSWSALADAAARDADGNALPAGTLALDGRNLTIRSSGPKVAAIGVEGLVIVATPDAVLVMRPEDAQRVREAAAWFDSTS